MNREQVEMEFVKRLRAIAKRIEICDTSEKMSSDDFQRSILAVMGMIQIDLSLAVQQWDKK